LRYIVKRLLIMVITLWMIVTLTFVLMVSIPGSPFNSENSSNEVVQENLEKHYHLDQPYVIQYLLSILNRLLRLISAHPLSNRTKVSMICYGEDFRFLLS